MVCIEMYSGVWNEVYGMEKYVVQYVIEYRME